MLLFIRVEVKIMGENEIKEPIQKRSIEKKDKIIRYGFDLICEKGYYNTNTAEIAKAAGVSTGIVYRYFKDKHDILLEGIRLYADSIFFPTLNNIDDEFQKTNLKEFFRSMINEFIENHKLSLVAHEEIMAMVHSDKEIADFYHQYELNSTKNIVEFLQNKGINKKNLTEVVHISMGLVDNLCHEVVYHKHNNIDYNNMIELVLDTIVHLIQ
jgi:AcrR family transcriptional regulator